MTRIKYMNIINTLLVITIFTSIVVIGNKPPKNDIAVAKNNQLDTFLESAKIEKKEEEKAEKKVDTKLEVETEKKTEIKKQEPINETKSDNIVKVEQKVVTEEKKVETKENVEEPTKPIEQPTSKQETVIEKLVGGLAGYGPDCSGCSPYTSTGMYIGNGNIYYQDKQYGKVRIVAGDKSFPFGTIVKISNTNYYNNEPIYAIVLDRGGIGRGKKFLFDLLFNSEKEASNIGSRQNVVFEILRLGY